MCSKEELEGLLSRKRMIDRLFITYSEDKMLAGNFQTLANLALIGGRLDAMIRQHGMKTRDLARRKHREHLFPDKESN